MRTKQRTTRDKALDRAASEAWHQSVVARGCEVCPRTGCECSGVVQAHHVVYAQHIRRWVSAHAWEHHLTAGEARELERDLMWRTENGLGVCYRAHRRHHDRVEVIPLALIPFPAVRFAAELGLVHRLERDYA